MIYGKREGFKIWKVFKSLGKEFWIILFLMNTQNIFYLFEEISPFEKLEQISTEYFNFFFENFE